MNNNNTDRYKQHITAWYDLLNIKICEYFQLENVGGELENSFTYYINDLNSNS